MREAGFSLLELAVALAVLGAIGFVVSSAYLNVQAARDRDRATQLGESLRESVRAFALANARLPCPDTDGDGWEGDAGGACPAAAEAGWFPYRSLGLDLPDARFRAAYGVYRSANADATLDADLAVRKERGTDTPGDAHYQDARDLIIALNSVAGAPPDASHARLTGNGGSEGAIDCAGNIRSHPAFFLVFPLEDRDGNGDRFDAVHGAGQSCAYAPGTPATANQDDVAIAESAPSLAGWLNARIP